MRIIIFILLFFSLQSQAQIIRANPFYRPFAVGSSCSYLLDQYSGAAAAYSLRKLDCDYAGSAIRVRRSNDNAEQDIGFTANGDLDTASLKTFVSTNSGYVVTWYDQSVNSRNVTQGTAAIQPRIVNAGTVERKGTNPAVRFLSASSTYLDGGDILDLSELYFNYYAVLDIPTANGSPFGKSKSSGQAGRWSFIKDGGTLYSVLEIVFNNNSFASVSYSNTDYSLFETYINKSTDTNQIKKNNSQLAAYTSAIPNDATNTSNLFYIGVYQNSTGTAPLAGYYFNGHIGELIIYRKYWTADERTAINSNINTYYSIY